MAYKSVDKWKDKKGEQVWGGDRLDRMLKEKDLEKEQNALTLLKHIDLKSLKYVADIGSGIGRRHIYFPYSEYIGFDREEIMVKNGKKVFPNLTFHQVDIQDLSDRYIEYQEYFDLALTFHVIQYNHPLQHPPILESIKYVLKPGGYFYMKENTIYEHNNIGYKSLKETHSINNSSYTAAGWIHLLKQHGFKLYKKDQGGHFLFIKN